MLVLVIINTFTCGFVLSMGIGEVVLGDPVWGSVGLAIAAANGLMAIVNARTVGRR